MKKSLVFSFTIFFISLTTLLFFIRDYGETYDEAFYLGTGEIYIKFLKTFDNKDILKITNVELPSWAVTAGAFFAKSKLFPNLISSERFHLVAAISSAVVVTVIFNLIYIYTKSLLASFFGSSSLLFYPQFFIHSLINSRDMALVAGYSISILLLLLFLKYRRNVFLISSAVTSGFTFDIKFNAVYLLLIVLFSLSIYIKNIKKAIFFFLIFSVIFLISVFIFWPYLWFDTKSHILAILNFFNRFYRGETVFFGKIIFSHQNVPWYYPLSMLAIFTPPPLLICVFIGIASILKNLITRKTDLSAVFLIWFSVPLLRFFIPKSSFAYDQIRHFLEVLPTLSILGALGLFYLYEKLNKSKILIVLSILIIFYQIYLVGIYHPYQTAYFNFLAGPSFYVNQAFDIEYWGHVYKEATRSLKNRYPKDTVFFMPSSFGYHLLGANQFPYKLTEKIDDKFDYVIFMNRKSFWYKDPYLTWLIKNKKPIFIIERQGKVIFYQFKPYKREFLKMYKST